jgi:glycerol kinase
MLSLNNPINHQAANLKPVFQGKAQAKQNIFPPSVTPLAVQDKNQPTPKPYILVLDHGTTGIRACLMDREGQFVGKAHQNFKQIRPQPGWVEHSPNTLWKTTLKVIDEALKTKGATWKDIHGVAITNQRETTVLWDAKTGKPIHNAIVWQCRRTSEDCTKLASQPENQQLVKDTTGLVIDAYFSASKIQWLLKNEPKAAKLLKEGRLRFGTVDSWILWNLSGGKSHVTDFTNASRTGLYNIHTQAWDQRLLDLYGIPKEILPKVVGSAEVVSAVDSQLTHKEAVIPEAGIPIAGVVGDQQAALFGQQCWEPGEVKSTFGTGAFLVMNLGETPVQSQHGLLTTLANQANGKKAYALEGSIFSAGTMVEWLKNLRLIRSPKDVDALAQDLPDNQGVYFVPGLAGLGAPYWQAEAKGEWKGMTLQTDRRHLVRSVMESIAFMTHDVLKAMEKDAKQTIKALKVDGGVTKSQFLMQFLADILKIPVIRNKESEQTAKGAGFLGGLATGFWKNPDAVKQLKQETEVFQPTMPEEKRLGLLSAWQKILTQSLG